MWLEHVNDVTQGIRTTATAVGLINAAMPANGAVDEDAMP